MPHSVTTIPSDGETVPAELVRAFAAHANRPALHDQDHRLSYAALADFVRVFLSQMRDDGPVGVFGTPSTLMGAASIAAVVTGRPFVHLDPAMPQAVLTNIVDELQVGTIITSQEPKPGQLPAHCRVITAASCLAPATNLPPLVAAPVAPTDIIYLVATSGTTGRPKCIPVTHDAAYLSYLWRDAYTPYDPSMKVGIYIFAIWEMFRPLRNGSELYFPGLNDLMSPQALVAFISRAGLDEMLFTPSFFEKALSAVTPEIGANLPLRRVVLNGEVVSDALAAEARAKLPNTEIWNLYSICETHDICMTLLDGARDPGKPVSVGVAMSHLRAVVLDDKDQPCPPGQPGLLHFEGPRMLGPGYINRPEDTAQRFRIVTLEGQERRLYDTGDQGYVTEDGQIYVMGRVAHMLKLRGHSIQTRELTETLTAHLGFTKGIPWVQQSDDRGQLLLFYYTADAAQRARNAQDWGIEAVWQRMPQALAEVLAKVLPRYCIPTYLVQLDEIPINPVSGKCDFKALPKPPQDDADLADDADALPVTRLAAAILRCPAGSIDPALSFHDLGGDSLMCVDLLLAIESDYGRQVDFDWALNLPLTRLHALLTEEAETAPTSFDRPGIFLTGATGFLGGHVLAEAARDLPAGHVVYCLVRPRNRDPLERLRTQAKAFGVAEDRIVAVTGSIDEARFGLDTEHYAQLAEQVSGVIHCAAMVNLAVDRARMEAWSQAGITTILQFCRDAGAALVFSSSTSVFPDIGGPFPEGPTPIFAGISGYGAAKIAAEDAIAASGLDASIIRLPSLCDLDAPNPKDLYETILTACRKLGSVPEGLCFKMTDVRAAARFLTRQLGAKGLHYVNLIADDAVTWPKDAPGLTVIPAEDWTRTAPLTAPEQRLLREAPTTLRANARFDNAVAKRLWAGLDLGPFAVSDPAEVVARRLQATSITSDLGKSYQSDPALT
ncbi:AMP-binding protein [Paracoccus aminophilus]|uniref:Non-ribosomal peptide synthetase n=1 Tax=Paracoccus aminophilus JCM 7686 TaxID=1367847 RepID=S5Y715_PARAH|nr:AMP-binding protein [Paracoccus aminophilus]AGT11360.1 non-ribosomal peptide synthetase [Paracoccus aminophilus JCM 7686]